MYDFKKILERIYGKLQLSSIGNITVPSEKKIKFVCSFSFFKSFCTWEEFVA